MEENKEPQNINTFIPDAYQSCITNAYKVFQIEVEVLWETSTKNVEIGKILLMPVASTHQFLAN